MLQQTQVERVIPIFERFVVAFPSFRVLADASQADIVRAWKGLGYNSRAVRLHRLACAVRDQYGGRLPRAERSLLSLPGIGPYTMRAIRAFAFGADAIALDTNIRRVVQRVRFGGAPAARTGTAEQEHAAAAFVVSGRGHEVNSALMDLGALICTIRAPKCLVCPLRAQCAAAPFDTTQDATHAQRRSAGRERRFPRFKETSRYLRGRIIDRLRELPPSAAISLQDLQADLTPLVAALDGERLERTVRALEADGIVRRKSGRLALG